MGILVFDQLLELSKGSVVVDFDLDNTWIGLVIRPDKAHKSQFLDSYRRCKEPVKENSSIFGYVYI